MELPQGSPRSRSSAARMVSIRNLQTCRVLSKNSSRRFRPPAFKNRRPPRLRSIGAVCSQENAQSVLTIVLAQMTL